MIVFGSYWIHGKKIADTKIFCPKCDKETNCEAYIGNKVGHIWGIPLIPLEKDLIFTCIECGEDFSFTEEKDKLKFLKHIKYAKKIKKEGKTVYKPGVSGLVYCAPAYIIISSIFLFSIYGKLISSIFSLASVIIFVFFVMHEFGISIYEEEESKPKVKTKNKKKESKTNNNLYFILVILIGIIIAGFIAYNYGFFSPIISPNKNNISNRTVYSEEKVESDPESNITVRSNTIFEENPNEIQKAYMKSISGIVKIMVYVDFDRFLPNIEDIDWTKYNNKIYSGEEATYYDLDIDYNYNTNYYDLMEQDWGDEYGSNVEDFPYSVGTGFILNPKGYILTNSHVLAIDTGETEEYLKNYYLSLFNWMMEDSYAYDINYTDDDYLDDWALYNFMFDNLEIRNLEIKTEVVIGADKLEKGITYEKYSPEIIDYEANFLDSETGTVSYKNLDWALLKISGNNYSTLPLGDSNELSVGSEVIILGYPSVSEDYTEDEEEYDFKINKEPTLTTGHISQTTAIEGNNYFQVDAGISEGNSGGPALNTDGEVIGIATLGLEEYAGGNYNYIIRINDIKNKLEKNFEPKQGTTDELWKKCLEEYWNGNYRESKENLEKLEEIYPEHPYLQNIFEKNS